MPTLHNGINGVRAAARQFLKLAVTHPGSEEEDTTVHEFGLGSPVRR
jgi:hypothetical protein